MYNIYTRKLESHDPKFLSTIRIPVNYNALAECPLFKKFLYDLMQGDEERIMLSEEIIGYCLTMLNCIQKGFFFYGTGSNGKSKFADIISYLCGKANISNMSLEVLGTRFGTETLPNKLVNISPENEFNGKYMDTSNFKSITGGDTMHINAKYKTGRSHDIFAKLISLLNKLPDTKDTSNGYFRRVLIIPFYNVFNGENDDKEIVDKLLNELEGILNVALEGLNRLIDNKFNLTESKVVNEIFNQYKLEQNPVEEFFQDKVISNEEASIKQCEILKYFKKWSIQNGYNDLSFISSTRFWNLFRKVLNDNGISYQNTKKIKGITYIVGITIE
jgi:putative DNA primase/helicase